MLDTLFKPLYSLGMKSMIAVQCTSSCNKVFTLMVVPADLSKWQNGELIQNAMPYLTPDERELLISGTCGDCWKKMFGE